MFHSNLLLTMIKEIKTEKFEGLAVLVPDDAYDFTNNLASHQIDYVQDINFNESVLKMSGCILLKNHWNEPIQILGKATELTEEQLELILPNTHPYRRPSHFYEILKANECYTVNPYGKDKGLYIVHHLGDAATAAKIILAYQKKWDEAEATTGTWIILQKLPS